MVKITLQKVQYNGIDQDLFKFKHQYAEFTNREDMQRQLASDCANHGIRNIMVDYKPAYAGGAIFIFIADGIIAAQYGIVED